MRVRMIIECDPSDLGRILVAMPNSANWHATRAPAVKHESPMRQAIISEMTPHAPKALPPKQRRGDGKNIRLVEAFVQANPNCSWSDVVKMGAAKGFARSNMSSCLVSLVAKGVIIKENGKHRIAEFIPGTVFEVKK